MRPTVWIIVGVLALCIAGAVLADQDVSGLPGYVDVETVLDGAHANVEVSLKGSLLSVLSAVARLENPQIGEVMSELELVRVFVFENANAAALSPNKIDRAAARLQEQGWDTGVRVQESKTAETVLLLTK